MCPVDDRAPYLTFVPGFGVYFHFGKRKQRNVGLAVVPHPAPFITGRGSNQRALVHDQTNREGLTHVWPHLQNVEALFFRNQKINGPVRLMYKPAYSVHFVGLGDQSKPCKQDTCL